MRIRHTITSLIVLLILATATLASTEDRRYPHRSIRSVPSEIPGSAAKDTTDMIGPYPVPDGAVCEDLTQPWNGTFETVSGAPHWSCWTHEDVTYNDTSHWHVATYHAVDGTYSAWCGDLIPACDPPDEEGGYGNNWAEFLDWWGTVPDPSVSTVVTLDAQARIDTEAGYDYVWLLYESENGFSHVCSWDGAYPALTIAESFTVDADSYMGPDNDQIHLRFEFTSDGAWSDEDCFFTSIGAIQLDNIVVRFDGIPIGDMATFESGGFEQGWAPALVPFVGDFAQLADNLEDLDPCRFNHSYQVIFIDDGEVVPGTGGSSCITWCYGPGGYIVNTAGGLAGPDYHINNQLFSPICEWPDPDLGGCEYHFDVYRHETLGPNSPGIFYNWGIRSVDTGNPDDLGDAYFGDRSFVYYGGPDYLRSMNRVSDLLLPGRTHVQVRLLVFELGWVWGWIGPDGYPAPYFDNVRLFAFPQEGPGISNREIDRFNDTFPENGDLSYSDLSLNWCRVDMARNISPANHLRNDPGDSTKFDIRPLRAGSVIEGIPQLVYKLHPNPLYDPYRIDFPIEGTVDGIDQSFERWSFDLPDTGFFWPGDVIHWYIEASDNVGGHITTATFPNDIDSDLFNDFSDGFVYNSSFTVRALPTMTGTTPEDQPTILWWNDFANRGLEEEWYMAFRNTGYLERDRIDVYYTNGPSSGVGNGLGGRATTEQIAGYNVLLYSCGDLYTYTLSNGDYQNDPGDDIGLLDNWLQLGGKSAYFTGDNLFHELSASGSAAAMFASYWLNVSLEDWSVASLIGGQVAPTVRTISGNTVLPDDFEWIAYGGCLGLNTFDAITTNEGCERVAEFLTSDGIGGQYPFAALTCNLNAAYDAKVLLQPYDLGYIYTPPTSGKNMIPLAARAVLLQEVLIFLGEPPHAHICDVPPTDVFSATSYPNPFNPTTRIEFNLPKAGHLTVTIFNLRGQLVTTLLDQQREAGRGEVVWNGRGQRGETVASGMYFYEVRYDDQVLVEKMTLLK